MPAQSSSSWHESLFKHRALMFGVGLWGAFAFYFVDPDPSARRIANLLQWGDGGVRLLLVLGSVLAFLGFLARLYGTGYLRAATVQSTAIHTKRLVTSGPYSRTRNPLYLGNMLIAFGFGFAVPLAGLAWILGLNLVLIALLVTIEEDRLHRDLGDRYRDYQRRVPRFLPRLRKVKTSSASSNPHVSPDWRDGFLGESWLASIPASTFIYASTLNRDLFMFVLGLTFAAGFVALLFYIRRENRRKEKMREEGEDTPRGFGFEA